MKKIVLWIVSILILALLGAGLLGVVAANSSSMVKTVHGHINMIVTQTATHSMVLSLKDKPHTHFYLADDRYQMKLLTLQGKVMLTYLAFPKTVRGGDAWVRAIGLQLPDGTVLIDPKPWLEAVELSCGVLAVIPAIYFGMLLFLFTKEKEAKEQSASSGGKSIYLIYLYL